MKFLYNEDWEGFQPSFLNSNSETVNTFPQKAEWGTHTAIEPIAPIITNKLIVGGLKYTYSNDYLTIFTSLNEFVEFARSLMPNDDISDPKVKLANDFIRPFGALPFNSDEFLKS